MNDLFKLFSVIENEQEIVNSYDDRKIGRTDVSGLTVSTCWTPDQDYETAVLDSNGVHVVQRYSNKEHAAQGHNDWCVKAKTIEKVQTVSYGDLIEGKEVTLIRTNS